LGGASLTQVPPPRQASAVAMGELVVWGGVVRATHFWVDTGSSLVRVDAGQPGVRVLSTVYAEKEKIASVPSFGEYKMPKEGADPVRTAVLLASGLFSRAKASSTLGQNTTPQLRYHEESLVAGAKVSVVGKTGPKVGDHATLVAIPDKRPVSAPWKCHKIWCLPASRLRLRGLIYIVEGAEAGAAAGITPEASAAGLALGVPVPPELVGHINQFPTSSLDKQSAWMAVVWFLLIGGVVFGGTLLWNVLLRQIGDGELALLCVAWPIGCIAYAVVWGRLIKKHTPSVIEFAAREAQDASSGTLPVGTFARVQGTVVKPRYAPTLLAPLGGNACVVHNTFAMGPGGDGGV